MLETQEPSSQQINRFYRTWLDDRFDQVANVKPENFEPWPGTILAKLVPPESVTKGGIILPDAALRQTNIAVVIAVNPTDDRLKPKDIIYCRGSGTTINFDEDGEFIVLQYFDGIEGDIMGKFKVDDG